MEHLTPWQRLNNKTQGRQERRDDWNLVNNLEIITILVDYKIGITKTEKPQNGIMEIKTRIQTLQNPKVKHSKNVKNVLANT